LREEQAKAREQRKLLFEKLQKYQDENANLLQAKNLFT
jgi:hypothetical protein